MHDIIRHLKKNGPVKIVEVGSFLGESALAMCELLDDQDTIYCVDNWKGCDTDNTGEILAGEGSDDIYRRFIENTKDTKQIIVKRGNSVDVASNFNDEADLIFIDAAHDYESVKADITAWFPHLKKGGVICGHDYQWKFPGVVQAANELFGNQIKVPRGSSMFVAGNYHYKEEAAIVMPTIATGGTIDPVCVQALFSPLQAGSKTRVAKPLISIGSVVSANNSIFLGLKKLRGECNYWLNLHSDVGPEIGFLDQMLADIGDADIITCSIPIKIGDGEITSTGVIQESGETKHITREMEKSLPAIYTADDIDIPGKFVFNTGCMLVKMGDWMDDFPGWHAEGIIEGDRMIIHDEDHCFALDVQAMGLKIKVTTKIECLHKGQKIWV